ncbi:MAG: GvpL/GvpF family gas vesicle protein, partial [Candidatus Rokuibacteriota bacterium]
MATPKRNRNARSKSSGRKPARKAAAARPARPGKASSGPPTNGTRARVIQEPTPRAVVAMPAADLTASMKPATESRGKYVYCVIRSAEPLHGGPIGIGAEPAEVHTVHYEDIAAVVSDTPIEVLDATRENVLAHER